MFTLLSVLIVLKVCLRKEYSHFLLWALLRETELKLSLDLHKHNKNFQKLALCDNIKNIKLFPVNLAITTSHKHSEKSSISTKLYLKTNFLAHVPKTAHHQKFNLSDFIGFKCKYKFEQQTFRQKSREFV